MKLFEESKHHNCLLSYSMRCRCLFTFQRATLVKIVLYIVNIVILRRAWLGDKKDTKAALILKKCCIKTLWFQLLTLAGINVFKIPPPSYSPVQPEQSVLIKCMYHKKYHLGKLYTFVINTDHINRVSILTKVVRFKWTLTTM